MGMFAYRAVDGNGRVCAGRLPAISASELESRLRSAGLELLKASPVRPRVFGGGIPRKELIGFCMHREQTLRAGLMITDALADQVDGASHARFRELLTVTLQAVREGTQLSDALKAFPEAFDDVFVGLVRSGESSGRLPDAFGKLGDMIKWQDELLAKTKKLLMYPAITVTVLVGVTVFVLVFLVPQLAGFIREMSGGKLPFQTRLLLDMSAGLVAHWGKLLMIPPVLAAAAYLALRFGGERLRYRIDRAKLRIPLVGKVLEKILIARFTALFGMLYAAGLPVLQAVGIGRDAVGNRHVAAAITQAMDFIEQGKGIGDAFEATGLFPRLVLRMIRIGESTGDLDKGLANISYFYNREIGESIEKVQALIEPALTLSLGLILGWLMMSVLGPIYDLLAKVKV